MIKLNGIDVSYAFLNSSSKTIRIHKKEFIPSNTEGIT